MLASYHTYKLPRPTTSSTPSKFEEDFEYNARGLQCRQAMRTRSCGGIPAALTFCYFLVKQKVENQNQLIESPSQSYLLLPVAQTV